MRDLGVGTGYSGEDNGGQGGYWDMAYLSFKIACLRYCLNSIESDHYIARVWSRKKIANKIICRTCSNSDCGIFKAD